MMDPSLKSDAEVACLVCADLATWSRGGGMSDVMPHAGRDTLLQVSIVTSHWENWDTSKTNFH